jgi:hypothetical protein
MVSERRIDMVRYECMSSVFMSSSGLWVRLFGLDVLGAVFLEIVSYLVWIIGRLLFGGRVL